MTTLNGVPLQGLLGGILRWKSPTNSSVGTAISAYVSPNLQGLDFSHKGEVSKIADQGGATAVLYVCDEWIELTFDYIPQGATSADAKNAATIPPLLSKAEICGLPVIPIGSFADGLNTHTGTATSSPFGGDAASTQPWVYEGDGGGSGKNKEHWDGKITLRRYTGILKTSTYSLVP
jgi:hypothetical protein